MKEKVYIETTIPSYLTALPSREIVALARQQITRDWWESKRHLYDLFVSDIVVSESARGSENAAVRRISAIEGIERLPLNDTALSLASKILKMIQLPSRASDDAIHIAIATVHQMDYIITWNFRHLANPHNFKSLREICRDSGYTLPEICTPEELIGD